jgi:hypothetical protein
MSKTTEFKLDSWRPPVNVTGKGELPESGKIAATSTLAVWSSWVSKFVTDTTGMLVPDRGVMDEDELRLMEND